MPKKKKKPPSLPLEEAQEIDPEISELFDMDSDRGEAAKYIPDGYDNVSLRDQAIERHRKKSRKEQQDV